MKATPIVNILYGNTPKNKKVTVQGWVRTRRNSKKEFSFLSIYDGSCISSIQVIVYNTIHNYTSEVLRLTSGCSVIITGHIIKSIGKKQDFEIKAEKIKILGWIAQPNTYPITSKRHTMEYLRNFAHLRPRTNIIGSISRIRHSLAKKIHQFLDQEGFLWIPTPIITSSDTEGNSKMFTVSTEKEKNEQNFSYQKMKKIPSKEFFGKKTFLTVSGQLNAEAYACALSKVYTFGPTFRAEYSNTSRHLSEFWMVEPEMAFANLDDIIVLAEHLLKNTIKSILKKCINDLNFFSNYTNDNLIAHLENTINVKFIQINYTDAVKILKSCKKKFNHAIYWGSDLYSEHEQFLTEEYFKTPVIIKNYPKIIKAFYMRLNDDEKTVAAMDILIPGIGEIIGGSQREERLELFDQRLQELNLNQKQYWWYRDLRRYGTVPHSGFGLGFERLLKYITGMKNIRDVIPFPRTPKCINF